MANPERAAMNYALLFAMGILGMFVAHFLASIASQATSGGWILPYWWGYPFVFPALASLWIHFTRSFWLSTAIVVCLAPMLYSAGTQPTASRARWARIRLRFSS